MHQWTRCLRSALWPTTDEVVSKAKRGDGPIGDVHTDCPAWNLGTCLMRGDGGPDRLLHNDAMRIQAYGLIFWFTRKTFFGSYLALISESLA
jgi:hypothetical protein